MVHFWTQESKNPKNILKIWSIDFLEVLCADRHSKGSKTDFFVDDTLDL